MDNKNSKPEDKLSAKNPSNSFNKLPVSLLNEAQPNTDISTLTSIDMPKKVGLVIFFLVFGIFGSWAAFAPLGGAALAPGVVTVKSYKKIIQHLEGGIVSQIYAANGDLVETGEPLLELDNTQSMYLLEIASARYIHLKAREARLLAESEGYTQILFPPNWTESNKDYENDITSERAIFASRKKTIEGSVAVLEQRIDQLSSKIIGLEALKESKEILAKSYNDELIDIELLLSQGFSDKEKLRFVTRSLASYKGEAADLTATLSSTKIQIGETRLQILQIEREFQNSVLEELDGIQNELSDTEERLTALNDIVSRTIIRAPVSGLVNGMQIHTVGGIIAPGQEIAEIVPVSEELVLEAQVSPLDIDRVYAGQEATIRFSSFGSKTPTLFGTLLSLSADAYGDQTTGQPFYLARIEVSAESLKNLGSLDLVPGMPAEVFISTGSRTMLQYLFKPFSNTVARSFIED